MSQRIESKEEFLNILREGLKKLDSKTQEEILYDYEEHFTIGLSKGMSEAEIAKALGSPRVIANQYRFEKAIQKAEARPSFQSIAKAIFVAMSLGFFNLVFVLGFYIGLVGMLFGLIVGFGVSILAGLVLMIRAFIPSFLLEHFSIGIDHSLTTNPLFLFAFGFIWIVLASGLVVLLSHAFRVVFLATIRYLKFNYRVILESSQQTKLP